MGTETADDGTIYMTLVTRFSTWEDYLHMTLLTTLPVHYQITHENVKGINMSIEIHPRSDVAYVTLFFNMLKLVPSTLTYMLCLYQVQNEKKAANGKDEKIQTLVFKSNKAKKGRNQAIMVDRLSRYLFPGSFLLFNICYWSIYTQSTIEI